MNKLLAAVMLAVLTTVPAVANACPQCAGNSKGGIGVGILIGSMIVLPFVVAGVIIKVIRRDF